MVESPFSKVTENFLHFENSILCIGFSRKVARLEISKNSLLTAFLGLQFTSGNATKN